MSTVQGKQHRHKHKRKRKHDRRRCSHHDNAKLRSLVSVEEELATRKTENRPKRKRRRHSLSDDGNTEAEAREVKEKIPRENAELTVQSGTANDSVTRKRKRRKKQCSDSGEHLPAVTPAEEGMHYWQHRYLCGGIGGEEGEGKRALREFHAGEDEFSTLHRQWVRTTPEEQKKLKEQVGGWQGGQWSAEEIRILKRNVKAYMEENKITDLSTFIFDKPQSKRKELYRYIAKDINRPLFSVYRKMIVVFNVENYVGRSFWTPEKVAALLRLHSLHGNQWVVIGRSLGVSHRAACDKWKSTRRKSKGSWSHEEEQRLKEIMEELWEGEGGEGNWQRDDLPPTSTWVTVAEKMGTRTATQCRAKWVGVLSWKERGGKVRWSLADDLRLVRTLDETKERVEDEVGWKEMCEGWEAARSQEFLRKKWSSLRRSVPNYCLKSFTDNLEYLMSHWVPAVERRLQERGQ